jgi:hypothetical protein
MYDSIANHWCLIVLIAVAMILSFGVGYLKGWVDEENARPPKGPLEF